MQIDLTGKIAIVTGATGQLGRVMTRTLAGCGADVAVHYHGNREKAEALCAEIRALGRRAAAFQADVGDPASVAAMGAAVAAELGWPHIVVANAVEQYGWTTVLQQNPADYESQFRTCVMHNVLMAQTFVPHMAERGYGRYVGINTECSIEALPTQSAYVAGKRGMDGVLRVLAKEVGASGVTVNQVAPGWTISERDRENHTERSAEYEAKVPLNRRGTDQEIANAVAFLASDLAGFITGAFLPVCGGKVFVSI